MNKALLIIDVQNDYFPGGRAELHGPPWPTLKRRWGFSARRGCRLSMCSISTPARGRGSFCRAPRARKFTKTLRRLRARPLW